MRAPVILPLLVGLPEAKSSIRPSAMPSGTPESMYGKSANTGIWNSTPGLTSLPGVGPPLVSGTAPQISSCALGGNMPSIRWCDRKLMKFHELEAQARASSAPNSTTATNSSSAPPTRFGWWMRNSSASWKSRRVSSGMRRSSSQRGARSRSTGSSSSALPHSSAYASGAFVPVKDLFSGPHQHARARADVLVEPLQVADAMRHSGDVRVHADRHYPRAFLAFGVQPVEAVDAAPQPFLRGMVLQHHHRDVVHLDGVGPRHHRPARGVDAAGLA